MIDEKLRQLQKRRFAEPDNPEIIRQINILQQRISGKTKAQFSGGFGICCLSLYAEKRVHNTITIPLGELAQNNYNLIKSQKAKSRLKFDFSNDHLYATPYRYKRLFEAFSEIKEEEELPPISEYTDHRRPYLLESWKYLNIKKYRKFNAKKVKSIDNARKYLLDVFYTWYKNCDHKIYKTRFFPKNFDPYFLEF